MEGAVDSREAQAEAGMLVVLGEAEPAGRVTLAVQVAAMKVAEAEAQER